jgi:hypothetical protein
MIAPSQATKAKGKARKPHSTLLLFWVVFAVLIGVVAWFVFRLAPQDNKVVDSTRSRQIAEAKPDIPQQPAEQTQEDTPVPEEEKPFIDPRFPYTDGRAVLSSRTNNWGQIIDICKMPNGKTRKVIRPAKPRVFTHATDQLLAAALSGNNDEDLPPLPIDDDMEADFLESLSTPIVINDEDSDEIKLAKQNVIDARAVMHEELRQGRSFKDVLQEHLNQRKLNAEIKEDAMQMVSELKKDGDTEMLNEYIQQINGLMRERGIGEIEVPVSKREYRGY